MSSISIEETLKKLGIPCTPSSVSLKEGGVLTSAGIPDISSIGTPVISGQSNPVLEDVKIFSAGDHVYIPCTVISHDGNIVQLETARGKIRLAIPVKSIVK